MKIEDDDLILTLTQDIRDSLKKSYPNLKIYTIKEYAGEEDYLDIKDPFGGDLLIYEMCFFFEIKEHLEKIAEKLYTVDDGIEIIKDETVNINLRLDALDKISDETILHDLTYSVSTIRIGKKAAEMIKNQNLLTNLVLNHPKFEIRQSACKNLKDNSILSYVVNNDSVNAVCLEAVKSIDDDEILKEIFSNSKNDLILIEIIKKISDNEALSNILWVTIY